MKFVTMRKPLKFDVRDASGQIVIPAGSKRIQIAFGQSHLVRNSMSGKIYPIDFGRALLSSEKRLNVYRRTWNGPKIPKIHA